MTGRRRALIIANDTYDHASLGQLRAPAADAEALAEVLGDPEIGGFTVSVVHNEPSHEVQAQIEDVFADSQSDDLLLLHFSGHGIKSDTGELFVAARNTRPDRLGSTGVSADFIQRCMRSSRARSVVLLLDCCYGGAFGEGVAVRAAGPVNVMDSFPASRLGGGRGRAVISASSAIEYAFEGTTLAADEHPKPSVFTSAVVDGLRTGDADRDEDGLVSLDELYDYVFDRVRAENPKQTPGRDVEMAGDLYIAQSRRRRLRPVPIPEAVAAALRETNPTYRRGAVSELRDRLWHEDAATALGAFEALREVARSDTKVVAEDAASALASAAPVAVPATVELPGRAAGSGPVTATIEVHGPALARQVTVDAVAPLEASVEADGRVTVTLSPTSEPFEGTVTITSPAGSVVVPVTAAAHPRAEHPADARVVEGPQDAVDELVERRVVPASPSGMPTPVLAVASTHASSTAPSLQDPASEGDGSPATKVLHGLTRRVVVAAMSIGGLLVIASYAAPWVYHDSVSATAPGVTIGLFILAIAAFVASIAVTVDQSRGLLSAGVVLGVSTTAATSSLTAFGLLSTLGPEVVGVGWVMGMAGQMLVILGGCVALVAVVRSQSTSLVWPSPLDRPRVAAIVLALAGAAILVVYAMFVGDADYNGLWGVIIMLWALVWLAVGAFAVSAGPAQFSRSFLMTWSLAAVSQPLSDLAHLAHLQARDGTVPSFFVPLLVGELVLLLGLVVVALTLDRTRPRAARQGR